MRIVKASHMNKIFPKFLLCYAMH